MSFDETRDLLSETVNCQVYDDTIEITKAITKAITKEPLWESAFAEICENIDLILVHVWDATAWLER